MQTTSHPIKANDLTVAYPSSGPHRGYAVIHATGCAHTNRRGYGASSHLGTGFTPGADDYFEVAPCARKAGA